MQIFKEFGVISGLHNNTTKSLLYVSGSNSDDLLAAASSVGMPLGTFPFRYLGLPLTTKSMSSQDYTRSVDCIWSRFLSWTIENLSFAGCHQIINSVIRSITNFWCSIFLLPSRCFTEIEKLCGAFLRSGSPNSLYHAKVSWNIIYPKGEGGLGIRKNWNASRVFGLSI